MNKLLANVYLVLFMLNVFGTEAKVVDLTYPYNDNATLFWPIYSPFEFRILYRGWLDTPNGAKVWHEYNGFSSPEHLGTHMDAPCHVANSRDCWRVHQIPPEHFIGDAVVIDISERASKNPDETLTVSDIENWEKAHGQIKDGSIVLQYSGWDQYWGNEAAYFGNDRKDTSDFHFPGFSTEAARWLVKNRVISGVGTDTIGFDAGANVNLEAHKIILSENVYGLENVFNLGKLPASGARIYVFPIKIRDGSGGPCRIIAEWDHHHVNSAVRFYMSFILVISLFLACNVI